jgi:large subunit ribosomal protein L24
MDKLIKRVRSAERQVSRKAAFIEKLQGKRARKERLTFFRSHHKQVHTNWKTVSQSIKLQWDLGPLAPKVDVGNGEYGTIDPQRANPDIELPQPFLEKRCAWAGGTRKLCLTKGDRVVILDGPDSGRIDTVEAIDMNNATVQLTNLHRVNVTVPAWLKKAQEEMALKNPNIRASDIPKQVSRPASLPISAIRLVHPLRDPKTGQFRDVIIRELVPVGVEPGNPLAIKPSFDQWEYGKKYDRMVPGLNVCIPWPEPEVPEYETCEADTKYTPLERKTFVPTLLKPPMPAAVLDELRGRYSKFRTRHEPWYIAKKEAEAVEKKLLHSTIAEMRTPLQDFHRAQKAVRRARGQPELTDDMLEAIGRIMEKNKLADAAIGAENERQRQEAMARITAGFAKQNILDPSSSSPPAADATGVQPPTS